MLKSEGFNGLEPQVHGLQGEGTDTNRAEKIPKIISIYVVGLLEDLNFFYPPAVPVLCHLSVSLQNKLFNLVHNLLILWKVSVMLCSIVFCCYNFANLSKMILLTF